MKSVNYILTINRIRHVACIEIGNAVITACPTLGGWYFRVVAGHIVKSSRELTGCL
jgi:hypothetical protein